jgi:hypothetical protein
MNATKIHARDRPRELVRGAREFEEEARDSSRAGGVATELPWLFTILHLRTKDLNKIKYAQFLLFPINLGLVAGKMTGAD